MLAARAAYHVKVARVFSHIDDIAIGSGLLLSLFAALRLFPGAGFLFGHVCFEGASRRAASGRFSSRTPGSATRSVG